VAEQRPRGNPGRPGNLQLDIVIGFLKRLQSAQVSIGKPITATVACKSYHSQWFHIDCEG
jgi:hypothetical protein